MNTYEGYRGKATHVPNLSTRWRWVITFSLQLFYPWGKPMAPIAQEAGWAQSERQRKREIPLSCHKMNPSCSVHSHFTDWVISSSVLITWDVYFVQVLRRKSKPPKIFQVIQRRPSEGSAQQQQVPSSLYKCNVCPDKYSGQSGWHRVSHWDADKTGTESL
jgi:hypothetical protein